MHTGFEIDTAAITAILADEGPVWDDLQLMIGDFALSDMEETEIPAGHA